MVALFKDGVDAAGVATVEQAEIVLVEDLLPSFCGLEVVRRVCDYAPRTLVAAHSADDTALQDYVAAGARAVFTRRLPPADVVAGLVGGLHR